MTSAMLRAGRVPAPEKITSSISRAAHLLGRGLAHHPLQRLDQVRLAAAVGADDAGHAGLDGELRRIDEGLEAGEPELVELDHLHHACTVDLLGELAEHARRVPRPSARP